MARCRCAEGACGCSVVAGTNTTVDGSGTPSDPFVVSAGDHGYLAVADSPTLDLQLLGDGTSANPHLLSGTVLGGGTGGGTDEVWIGPDDPQPTNPTIELWYDSDAVGTPVGAQIVFTDTGEVDFTTTGLGVAGDPMHVTAELPLITFTGGIPGHVLTQDANGVFSPMPATTAPVGAVATGHGIKGDGSAVTPLRVNLCTYDDLKAACAP